MAPERIGLILRRLALVATTLGADLPDEGSLEGVVRGLTSVLERIGPLERTQVVAEWATDQHEGVRLVMAHVLSAPLPAVSAPLAIEHLARDPSPRVRAAAELAAKWIRCTRGPGRA